MYKNRNMPSWSWMAYNKGIQFMDIPFGEVYWIDNLQFDKKHNYVLHVFFNKIFNKKGKHALITDIGRFWNCSLEQKGIYYAILDSSKTERGRIQYDITGGEDLHAKRCVVVRRKSHKD